MFVYIDDIWHPLGEDETTVCGLIVPHGSDWARMVPDGELIHCGSLATKPVDKPAPKAKAKAKKG